VLNLPLHNTMQQLADSLAANAVTCFGPMLGAGSPVQNKTWNIYPNPATKELNVEIDRLQLPAEISLRDMSGRLLKAVCITAKGAGVVRIEIAGVPSGIYVLALRAASFYDCKRLVVAQ
jgi:hypothetical protein